MPPRPWNLTLQPTAQSIPPEKTIHEVFVENGRSLLILGPPASGKTITLLQLAQTLVTRAHHHTHEPIPIILNLSSWAKKRAALIEWLVEELLWQYQLPPNLSRAWLEESRFTLLLDGLDEVQAGVRDACIEAINTFLADYPAEVVVCSRHQDYEQLQQRLNLRNALLIQTLTPEQIDTYLAQFGPYTTPLRHTIQHHPTWQTLATSPLMLNLMLLTYTDPDTPPPDLNNPHQQRYHLFSGRLKG